MEYSISKDELYLQLKKNSIISTREGVFKKNYPQFYQDLLTWSFPCNFTFGQKLYHYINNDFNFKLGLCPVCNNRCKFKGFFKGYYSHCSVKCAGLDKDVQLLKENTCINHFGVKHPAQSDIIQSKMINTNLERRGVKNPAQDPNVKLKMINTNLERYGVNYITMNPDVQKKIVQTNLERYGVKCTLQDSKVKNKIIQTNLERRGVKYPAQDPKVYEKFKQTCLETFGYCFPAQSPQMRAFRRKQIKYDGLIFDSSWEVNVYQYCKDNNISCIYQPDITFEYKYDGKTHIYQPDFLIDGKLYEVKGNHFFKDNDSNNEMINPFNRDLDGIFEAKHQCIIDNNVIVLTKYEINHLDEFIKKKLS